MTLKELLLDRITLAYQGIDINRSNYSLCGMYEGIVKELTTLLCCLSEDTLDGEIEFLSDELMSRVLSESPIC